MRLHARQGGIFIGTAAGLVSVAAALAQGASSEVADAADGPGRRLYETHCASCHGSAGKGDGPASAFLLPRPNDFTAGRFKIRSTAPGAPPTDADLLRTLTRGIPNSAMPAFAFLSEGERRAVIQHLKTLSGKFPSADHPPLPVRTDAAPPMSRAAVAAGKSVYDRLQCGACHGAGGKADGPVATALRDAFNLPIKPRNFTREPFKGGREARDIFLRISTGMEGTPMPAFSDDQVTVHERWQLAYYVQSLCQAPACRAGDNAENNVVVSKRLKTGLPEKDPLSPAWRKAPRVRVSLSSLWYRDTPAPELSIRSLNDGRTIAFLLEWADSTRDTHFVRPEDFRDAVAIQFSERGRYEPIAMGSRDTQVSIWQWKADWQEQIDQGRRTGAADIHPWRIEEPYPAPAMTALQAGNQAALQKRASPAEEATARGFGNLARRPIGEQSVTGKGIWRDGRWHVVLSRELAPAVGKPPLGSGANIAFAVWNGSERDRNGQKAISGWYSLTVESQ